MDQTKAFPKASFGVATAANQVEGVDCDDYGNGTYKRLKKKSFDWYKHVIETNGACLFEED